MMEYPKNEEKKHRTKVRGKIPVFTNETNDAVQLGDTYKSYLFKTTFLRFYVITAVDVVRK